MSELVTTTAGNDWRRYVTDAAKGGGDGERGTPAMSVVFPSPLFSGRSS